MDSTQLFSGLDERYSKYRPHYPAEILDILFDYFRHGRNNRWPARPLLVDVGAGTGILTRQLRERFGADYRYIAVEPGDSMRSRAEFETDPALGIEFSRATAEALGLAAGSAAIVIAGQAAHWFDRPRFYAEARRVLYPGGVLALVYNDRDWRRDAMLAEYEDFLESRNPRYHRGYREADPVAARAGSGLAGLRSGAFAEEMRQLDGFRDFTAQSVEWKRTMSADEFVGMCLSTVQFRRAVKSAHEHAEEDAEEDSEEDAAAILRAIIARHSRPGVPLILPYCTTLLAARRL